MTPEQSRRTAANQPRGLTESPWPLSTRQQPPRGVASVVAPLLELALCDTLDDAQDDFAHCCFCYSIVDRGIDGLTINVTKAGTPARQPFGRIRLVSLRPCTPV